MAGLWLQAIGILGLLVGWASDALGMSTAIVMVAAITAASGLVVALRLE